MLVIPSTIAAPACITVAFYTPSLGFDLTTVTGVAFQVLRHDGTTTSFAATIVSATQTELVAQYQFVGGEITTTGAYLLAPQLSVPGGFVPAETVTMVVSSPFQAAPKLTAEAWVTASSKIGATPYVPTYIVLSGVGSPNGAVNGSPGALYVSTSGGSGTTLYVKESGVGTNTGWVGK